MTDLFSEFVDSLVSTVKNFCPMGDGLTCRHGLGYLGKK
jgi:hypothetical protein